MKNDKFLLIDTELTSFNPINSLITAYLAVIKEGKILDEIDLKLSPNDGLFVVHSENMKVNNLDLRNWNGIKYKEAKSIVYDFLARNSGCEKINNKWTKNDDFKRLRVLGQGIRGDIDSIQNNLISKENWGEFVSSVVLDTTDLAAFLRNEGLLDLESISLKSLADCFGIDTTDLHDAKFDALLAYQIYTELITLIK